MTAQHTSSPWHFAAWDGFNGRDGFGNAVEPESGFGGQRVVHDEESRIIACRGDDLSDDEWERVGRLIAAAPELLKRCEVAANVFEEYAKMHRVKRTAEGDAKARRNDAYVAELREAIARATGAA